MNHKLFALLFAGACASSTHSPDAAFLDASIDASAPDSSIIADASQSDSTVPLDSGTDAVVADAGPALQDVGRDVPEGERVTYNEHVQPILSLRCLTCHTLGTTNNGNAPLFATNYAVTQEPSGRCSGITIGECVLDAVRDDARDSGRCQSSTVYHRDGIECLDEEEIELVAEWVTGGMLEF